MVITHLLTNLLPTSWDIQVGWPLLKPGLLGFPPPNGCRRLLLSPVAGIFLTGHRCGGPQLVGVDSRGGILISWGPITPYGIGLLSLSPIIWKCHGSWSTRAQMIFLKRVKWWELIISTSPRKYTKWYIYLLGSKTNSASNLDMKTATSNGFNFWGFLESDCDAWLLNLMHMNQKKRKLSEIPTQIRRWKHLGKRQGLIGLSLAKNHLMGT